MAEEQNIEPTASQEEIAAMREKMGILTDKVKSDSAFAEKLKSDPIVTLQDEGFDESSIGEMLNHWKAEPEVEGHLWAYRCVYFTQYYEWFCTFYTG